MENIISENFYRRKTNKIGENGELGVQFFCELSGVECIEPDPEFKKNKGVDFYLDGVPTDVKATPKIFLGNYRLENHANSYSRNSFMVRHPFKPDCEATDYCILNIDPIGLQLLTPFFWGSIEEYLSNHIFNDLDSANKVKEILNSFDRKSFSDLNYNSVEEMLDGLKNKIQPYCRPSIEINYLKEQNQYTQELQFYLIDKKYIKLVEERAIAWKKLEELRRKKTAGRYRRNL